MKLCVPPYATDTDCFTRLGSHIMVESPKSARHAETGLAFVIRIFA